MMTPWADLPLRPPFVLPCDRPFVDVFNRCADERTTIRTDLLPEPFLGRANAPVVLLLLNPGFDSGDAEVHGRADFAKRLRVSLAEATSDHLLLGPDATGPGHRWWVRAVSGLARATSQVAVARGLLAVEFFPYHSVDFDHGHLRLPSQAFTFGLVQDAMDRGAEIVMGRGHKQWLGALPALDQYARLSRLKNPRRTTLSRGNWADVQAFERVVTVLRQCVA